MTQITASAPNRNMEALVARARVVGNYLLVAALAFVLGMFVFAPMRARSQPTNLPAAYVALPTGVVSLQTEDGLSALLPVRIADTSSARMIGFADVGESALANQFLLYGQTRQTTARASYAIEKVRVPLELAVINGEGEIVAITTTTVGQERVTVTEPHRWLLAAKQGTFTHYGIEPGMKLDPESIRKINL